VYIITLKCVSHALEFGYITYKNFHGRKAHIQNSRAKMDIVRVNMTETKVYGIKSFIALIFWCLIINRRNLVSGKIDDPFYIWNPPFF